MSVQGNQTMVNEFASYYLKAGADPSGVPSPFSVVDESGGINGSRVTIADNDSTATITNRDISGNTISTMTMDPSGNLSFTTQPPPLENYNLNITPSNARFTKPLIVQSGSLGGLSFSNDLGTGFGIIRNSVNAPPGPGAQIGITQTGVVNLNNGAVTATSNITYFGVQNTSGPTVQVSNGTAVNFADSGFVTRGGVSLTGVSEVNVGGPNLNLFANQDVSPIQVMRATPSNMTLTHPSNITMSVGGSNRIFASAAGMDLLGTIGIPPTAGSINMNGNPINSVGSLTLNNGGTVNGVGTLNMANGSGFASGTISGLSNVPTAGNQPITFTGYNPGNPTPSVTITSGGTIGTANSTGWSTIGGVDLGRNYNGVTAPGGLGNFSFKNVYYLDATSSSLSLVSLGDPATASILIATNYFVFGNNAGNVFDFHNVPAGAFMFLLLTGENNHGGGIVYWSGTAITWNSYGAGGGAQGPSGGSYTTSVNPVSGLASRWDYSYTGHAASGYGGIIMFRIV